MIKANDSELTLIFGLMLNPVMIPDCTDFSELELNRIPFLIIDYLRQADFDRMVNNGCGIIPILNLKRKKAITEKEKNELIALFGEYPTAQCYILESYYFLKAEAKKRLLSLKLSNLDLEQEPTELQHELVEASKIIEYEDIENIETLQDVLPRCNKPQKSLVIWNHERMQHEIGIEENYLVILGARPSVGKTTFAVKIALENSKNSKILFYSLELTKEQIARKTKSYGSYYKHSNVYIKQQTTLNLMQIRREAKQYNPKFILIDQLNKIDGEGKTELEKLTNVIRALKILAGDIKTPLVVLHQISRAGADTERPMMHQLKGSGAIEEEADVVLLLGVDAKECITSVYCDKNRSLEGKVGKYDFKFDVSTGMYKELW